MTYPGKKYNLLEKTDFATQRNMEEEIRIRNMVELYFNAIDAKGSLFVIKEDEDLLYQLLSGGLQQLSEYLTVYAFSTENWSRPENEVAALMKLLRNYMKTCLKTAAKNDMKIRVIGDIEPLDDDIKSRIRELEAATTDNGGLNFTIALNYGSRDELTRAAQKMAKDCAEGKIKAEEIDESVFETYLDTHGIPDPDMMIRTSGEQRLSNYLLWQLAYSEFYFTDVPWPDFTKEELVKAIEEYNHRHRRFGKVEEA